jgi:hypothetical protein
MAAKKATISKCSKTRNTTKEIARQCGIGMSVDNLNDEIKLFLDDEFTDNKHDWTVHIPFEQVERMYKFMKDKK